MVSMILRTLKPKYREQALRWMQATALLSLCTAILLQKLIHDNIAVSLISGILLGYSIVGNLVSLYYLRNRKETPK